MTHSSVNTVSGVVKAGSGQIFSIHITKLATGTGSVTIYDNPTAASGTVLWQADGLTEGAFDVSDGNGTGLAATQGIYCAVGGTTNATVVTVYQ